MPEMEVGFLNPRGIAAGSAETDIAEVGKGATAGSRDSNHFCSLGAGRLRRQEDVLAVAAGGDPDEEIPSPHVGANLALEHLFRRIVIHQGSQGAGIHGEGMHIQGCTLLQVPSDQLRRPMLGIRSATAIACQENPAAGSQGGDRQFRCRRGGSKVVLAEGSKGVLRFLQALTEQVLGRRRHGQILSHPGQSPRSLDAASWGALSLRATSLTVAFGTPPKHPVLQDLDFELEAGRFDVILGANGVGKSTLLRALAGLLPAQGGEVHFDGRPLSDLSMAQRARAIGFLPQEVTPAFAYTVEQAVALGARVAGHGHWFGGTQSAADRQALERALDLVETRHLQGRRLDTLSGGERRRVLIASVLAQEPQVLLLDEPGAMLDLHHQAELFRLLARLAGEGLAVACVTHDWNLAVGFADRLTILKEGGVLASGAPKELSVPDILQQVYGDAVVLITAPDGRPVVVPR